MPFLSRVFQLVMKKSFFITVPLSALLIGLEELIEFNFSCPCLIELNGKLTATIFIGPALFIFALMCLLLRPFRYGWFCCQTGVNDHSQKFWPEAFASCLIPPVMWVIILLLDGDYVLCGKTDWKGVYMFDNELNRSWCKPTEVKRLETELRDLARKHIHESQFAGYVTLGMFSGIMITCVIIFDCCQSGKCDNFSSCSKLLKFCGRTHSEPLLLDVENPPPEIQMERIYDTTEPQQSVTRDTTESGGSATTGGGPSSCPATGDGQQETPSIEEHQEPLLAREQ